MCTVPSKKTITCILLHEAPESSNHRHKCCPLLTPLLISSCQLTSQRCQCNLTGLPLSLWRFVPEGLFLTMRHNVLVLMKVLATQQIQATRQLQEVKKWWIRPILKDQWPVFHELLVCFFLLVLSVSREASGSDRGAECPSRVEATSVALQKLLERFHEIGWGAELPDSSPGAKTMGSLDRTRLGAHRSGAVVGDVVIESGVCFWKTHIHVGCSSRRF